MAKNVKQIENSAFEACENLKDVFCYGQNPPVHNGYYKKNVTYMFTGCNLSKATLHVPESAIDTYQVAYPWSEFGNIVALTEEEMAIENIAINGVEMKDVYDLSGRRNKQLQQGLNLIRMKDGKTKKVWVK